MTTFEAFMLEWKLKLERVGKMRTKNPKKIEDVKKFLSNAAAHYRWGSNADNTIRNAEPADLDAAKILEELREEL